MYKLHKDLYDQDLANVVIRLSDKASIPFAPGNTDYANFKTQILNDEAQLQDADGNLMMADAAKAFVESLP